MKKLFGFILVFGILFQAPVYSADQWDESQVAGTRNASDIDAYMIVNNEALDRVNRYLKFGMGMNYATAATLTVLTGSIAIPNAGATTIRWRSNTASTSVGWSDIDTGAEASSTTYYVYATADTDITGMVFKISASSSAPSGSTYYRSIGQFYNDSSSNITDVISYRSDQGTDYPDVIEGWVNFQGTGTVTINDSYNVASITDNGTGDYTVTWSTAFANANYSVTATCSEGVSSDGLFVSISPTSGIATTSCRVVCRYIDNTARDATKVCIKASGDRA